MNRYSANDFNPNAGQIARGMGHSIFDQVEIDHTVTNQEMADKVVGIKPEYQWLSKIIHCIKAIIGNMQNKH